MQHNVHTNGGGDAAHEQLQAAQFNSAATTACLQNWRPTVSEQPKLGLATRINSEPTLGHTQHPRLHIFLMQPEKQGPESWQQDAEALGVCNAFCM
jgi:hypothetical protein